MRERSCLAIVLAAGEGTRMRSARAKVLHEVGGRSLLAHVLDAVRAAGSTATAVVIGPDAEPVAAEAKRVLPDGDIYVQSERRGTAHAVLCGSPQPTYATRLAAEAVDLNLRLMRWRLAPSLPLERISAAINPPYSDDAPSLLCRVVHRFVAAVGVRASAECGLSRPPRASRCQARRSIGRAAVRE